MTNHAIFIFHVTIFIVIAKFIYIHILLFHGTIYIVIAILLNLYTQLHYKKSELLWRVRKLPLYVASCGAFLACCCTSDLLRHSIGQPQQFWYFAVYYSGGSCPPLLVSTFSSGQMAPLQAINQNRLIALVAASNKRCYMDSFKT